MAAATHGILGQITSNSGTQTLYTVPTGRKATVVVHVVSTTTDTFTLGIVTSPTTAMGTADHLEQHSLSATPYQTRTETYTLQAGKRLLVNNTNAGGVYMKVFGIEEDAL